MPAFPRIFQPKADAGNASAAQRISLETAERFFDINGISMYSLQLPFLYRRISGIEDGQYERHFLDLSAAPILDDDPMTRVEIAGRYSFRLTAHHHDENGIAQPEKDPTLARLALTTEIGPARRGDLKDYYMSILKSERFLKRYGIELGSVVELPHYAPQLEPNYNLGIEGLHARVIENGSPTIMFKGDYVFQNRSHTHDSSGNAIPGEKHRRPFEFMRQF